MYFLHTCPGTLKLYLLLSLGASVAFGVPFTVPQASRESYIHDPHTSSHPTSRNLEESLIPRMASRKIEPKIAFTSPKEKVTPEVKEKIPTVMQKLLKDLQIVSGSDEIAPLDPRKSWTTPIKEEWEEEKKGSKKKDKSSKENVFKVFKFTVTLPATWPKTPGVVKNPLKRPIVLKGTLRIPRRSDLNQLDWDAYSGVLVDESKGMAVVQVVAGQLIIDENPPLDPNKKPTKNSKGKTVQFNDKVDTKVIPNTDDDKEGEGKEGAVQGKH
ncbi:hypothetical protein GYMLUDRAFT_87480 [Collybiopsis luxurians FD-317 M1]|uniref:Unplaced genomic scaffold GYMLUscaffold_55, whole genome shotgun sequence n=1 Tax=Collybiopsis luxurians FD-317 M1 TaxID=944289 RepID=A0A0D0C0C1_9AGAR|nr:hypothetical protein GYMLUDRAFT_87480 [Collybiopsis luxurians FD-317 M1]